MTTQPPPAQIDDGLEWLREIRRKITAEFDHNPHRLGDKLREMEKLPEYAHRIVRVKKVLVPLSAEQLNFVPVGLRKRMIDNICQRIYSAYTRSLPGTLIKAVCLYNLIAFAMCFAAPYVEDVEFLKGASAEAQSVLGYVLVVLVILFSLIVAPLLQKTEPGRIIHCRNGVPHD